VRKRQQGASCGRSADRRDGSAGRLQLVQFVQLVLEQFVELVDFDQLSGAQLFEQQQFVFDFDEHDNVEQLARVQFVQQQQFDFDEHEQLRRTQLFEQLVQLAEQQLFEQLRTIATGAVVGLRLGVVGGRQDGGVSQRRTRAA
jgi:hypothetical protein